MDVFYSNGEALRMLVIVVAVPRAVEEESRDVRAGVLRYYLTNICRVFCKVNYQ